MFIIMKSAEKTEIRRSTFQNAKNTETSNVETMDYKELDLNTINEGNWKTKKKCKILHRYEDDPTENREEKEKIKTHIEPSSQTIDNKVEIKQEVTPAISEKTDCKDYN